MLPRLSDRWDAAKLTLCGPLLLAISDCSALLGPKLIGIVPIPAAGQESRPRGVWQDGLHDAVAALINDIIAGRNVVVRWGPSRDQQ